MHCDSMAAASDSATTRTGTVSRAASLAARKRRAPAITSYLSSSNSRTKRGARMPWLWKLAASSCSLSSLKRRRGLVADSTSAVMGRLGYSGSALGFADMTFSPFGLWLGFGITTHLDCEVMTFLLLAARWFLGSRLRCWRESPRG